MGCSCCSRRRNQNSFFPSPFSSTIGFHTGVPTAAAAASQGALEEKNFFWVQRNSRKAAVIKGRCAKWKSFGRCQIRQQNYLTKFTLTYFNGFQHLKTEHKFRNDGEGTCRILLFPDTPRNQVCILQRPTPSTFSKRSSLKNLIFILLRNKKNPFQLHPQTGIKARAFNMNPWKI